MMSRVGFGLVLALALAPQKGTPPDRKAYDPFHDANVQKAADDSQEAEKRKRQEADRRQMATEAMQKGMARDAAELVRMVTELQTRVEKDEAAVTSGEMRRQVEAIEKMARSMKKRAKGEQL